jgi:hypothetical protein
LMTAANRYIGFDTRLNKWASANAKSNSLARVVQWLT